MVSNISCKTLLGLKKLLLAVRPILLSICPLSRFFFAEHSTIFPAFSASRFFANYQKQLAEISTRYLWGGGEIGAKAASGHGSNDCGNDENMVLPMESQGKNWQEVDGYGYNVCGLLKVKSKKDKIFLSTLEMG